MQGTNGITNRLSETEI